MAKILIWDHVLLGKDDMLLSDEVRFYFSGIKKKRKKPTLILPFLFVSFRQLFWTVRGSADSSGIGKSNLDGSGRQDKFYHKNNSKPFYLCVDHNDRRLLLFFFSYYYFLLLLCQK